MSGLDFACALRLDARFELDAAFRTSAGVTALFGPSGAGKSTTLALIAGVARPDRGTIALDGRTLVDRARRVFVRPERRGIGVVFQDALLFPHLSVEQNLRFGMRRARERAPEFDRVVRVLELADLLGRAPGTLSGGQRQRTALGRALLSGPALLLLDEPLTAIDERLKDRVLAYLERVVAEWAVPTIFVSHDEADVRRLAGEVVVLDQGRVVASGETGATLDRWALGGEDAAGPLNLVLVEEVRGSDGGREGRIGAHGFALPEGFPPGRTHVRFSARDVVLARGEPGALSARIRLPGVIRDVVDAGRRHFVAVDVGPVIWSEVTASAIAELGLARGATVTCLVKASALVPVG